MQDLIIRYCRFPAQTRLHRPPLAMSARLSLSAAATLACVLVLLPLQAQSQTALSDWIVGTLTNYGGAQDGMDPYDPSYGTLDVRIFS